MKNSYISQIVGKRVIDVSKQLGEYWGLNGADKPKQSQPLSVNEVCLDIEDFFITITNPISLEGAKELHELKDRTVTHVVAENSEFILKFNGELTLSVDLREESWVGPEAICLTGPNALVVVWH